MSSTQGNEGIDEMKLKIKINRDAWEEKCGKGTKDQRRNKARKDRNDEERKKRKKEGY